VHGARKVLSPFFTMVLPRLRQYGCCALTSCPQGEGLPWVVG
jgi:hypothetical protein